MAPHTLDHLVYATPNLAESVEALSNLLGVRPSPGGAHPGRGTRNALLALSPTSYLEIIGPDPEQPEHAAPRWFAIDTLSAPRLVTWAAKATGLTALRARAAERGVTLGAVAAGRRQRPDGVLLSWELTDPTPLVADGLVPFFIDWGESPHPAANAAAGVTLADLRAEHPAADSVAAQLAALNSAMNAPLGAAVDQRADSAALGLSVASGALPALIATLDTRRGRVELR